MSRFWAAFTWVLGKMKAIGAVCLVGMVLLTCVDVVGRFFGHPVFGSVELVGFMATLTVVLALPYTHQEKGHIGVELLVARLSLKTQALFGLFTGILSLLLFGIIAWRMAVYARTIQRSGEVSMNLELPEHIIIYITAFCFGMFFLLVVQDIMQLIRKLRENEWTRP